MTLQQKKIKNELFNSMKSLGLETSLKTQIRAELCQKLKEKQLIRDKDKNKSHDDKLFSRILVSIIAQELQKSGCQYTYSVYSAQSGYDDKMLSTSEILQILGADNQSNSSQQKNSHISIIANILKKKYPFSGGTFRNNCTQTNPQEAGFTIEQRLAKIDIDYRNSIVKDKPKNALEEIKQKVQVIQAQLKKNFQKDIQRFKQFQAHAIKVNVSQEWRKKFEEYSQKLQVDYSRKMHQLRQKYKNIEDDLVNRTKAFEEKVNTATKSIAQKIQLLDMKSKTMDQTRKNLQIQKKRNREDAQAYNKQLKKKIAQYDSLLINVNKKIEYEVGVSKLAIQQQYQQKQTQFLERKKYIDQEYSKLMGIKQTMDIIKQESDKLHLENTQLRSDLTTLQQQLRIAISENGSKSDRLDALKAEIFDIKTQNRKNIDEKLQQVKKRKKIQRDLTETRKQLEQLREWKERNIQNSHMQSNLSDVETPQIIAKTQLELKMQALRQERKKQIEKLKLQL